MCLQRAPVVCVRELNTQNRCNYSLTYHAIQFPHQSRIYANLYWLLTQIMGELNFVRTNLDREAIFNWTISNDQILLFFFVWTWLSWTKLMNFHTQIHIGFEKWHLKCDLDSFFRSTNFIVWTKLNKWDFKSFEISFTKTVG